MNNIGNLIGEMMAFRNSLKIHHWLVTGTASYARHMALDQAVNDLDDIIDRIAETTIAVHGAFDIIAPMSSTPTDIISSCKDFYKRVDDARELFSEIFTQAIIDDFQEGVQNLIYRLERLQ